jgi:peptidoglycan/LPS O-acetylase OafA/YrhL
MKEKNTVNQDSNIPWLDGLRGFAALWVLASHVQILSGLNGVKILSWGALAVDLFMILSGFLMAFHYLERQAKEPWTSRTTILKFWLRRFFRIAPLFYILLIISFLLGPWLGECRTVIASHWPATATSSLRYEDNSLFNFFIHISFIFGVLPEYSFRSPLPDWSIGLEMQFYLAFPFIMLLIAKWGPVVTTVLLLLICFCFKLLFPDFFHAFSMPAFLMIKLQVFLIGIWIAYSRWQGKMSFGLVISLVIGLIWVLIERNDQSLGRLVLIVVMFYLLDKDSLPATKLSRSLVKYLRMGLSTKIGIFFGEASYASYLLHLLIVIPLAAFLTTVPFYMHLNGVMRFFVCLITAAIPVYFFAWLLYLYVEKPGIKLGKKLISYLYRT